MKRAYEAGFAFNAGAAIASVVIAHMFGAPQLAFAAPWFALGAAGFWVGLRALR